MGRVKQRTMVRPVKPKMDRRTSKCRSYDLRGEPKKGGVGGRGAWGVWRDELDDFNVQAQTHVVKDFRPENQQTTTLRFCSGSDDCACSCCARRKARRNRRLSAFVMVEAEEDAELSDSCADEIIDDDGYVSLVTMEHW